MSAALHQATGADIQILMNPWIISMTIQLLPKQTGLDGHAPINGKMESSSSTVTYEPRKNSGFQYGAMLTTMAVEPC